MNDQIEMSKDQPRETGLLDKALLGDAKAIQDLTGLVADGCFSKEQLALIFDVARVAVYKPRKDRSNSRNLLRETAKKIMPTQFGELLQLIVKIDPEIARTMLELVKENSVEPDQLPDILSSAVTGMINLGIGKEDNIFYDLARTTACKMPLLCPEQVQEIHNNIVSVFTNPEKSTTEELRVFSEIEAIFIEHGIIRNGRLIELAGKVADGISASSDPEKTRIIKEFGERVLGKMPGAEIGDLASIYNAIFRLAEFPNRTIYKNRLQTRLDRYEEGEPNLHRILTDAVVQRMREAISPKPKDGDPNLPKPRRWRITLTKVTQFLTTKSRKGRQLAFVPQRGSTN